MFYLKAQGAETFAILHTVLSHIYILRKIGTLFNKPTFLASFFFTERGPSLHAPCPNLLC